MELPASLKKLYRHWPYHTLSKVSKPMSLFRSVRLEREVRTFVLERIRIWKEKTSGAAPPYTEDPVLSTYRFCNIFREFDRQTIEFHTLLNPLRNDFPLWLLNMFYCRMVARTETIRYTGLLTFDAKENEALYERLMHSPRPRFGTPYVFPVSVIMKSATPTREKFIAYYLPRVMQTIASEIEGWRKESVESGVRKIAPLFGYNLTFLWTEVLIDVAYQYPDRIDLFARFPVGPGSIPTMRRIHPKKDPSELVAELGESFFDVGLTYNNTPLRLSAENWEGVGCEFRKYTNLKAGKGRRRVFQSGSAILGPGSRNSLRERRTS
jgi:hypothetical protein